MNPAALAQAMTEPTAFDASRYPTAYAVDFVLAHGPAFRRLTGFDISPSMNNESARRQAALDALDDLAFDGGYTLTEVLTAMADQHLAVNRISIPTPA